MYSFFGMAFFNVHNYFEIHDVVLCIGGSFLLTVESSPLCECTTILFIHSSVNGHSGCFQLFSVNMLL